MTVQGTYTTSEVSSEDISKVLDALLPAVEAFPRHHLIIAFISLAITLQAPSINPDDLYDAIRKVSQKIVTVIQERPSTEMPLSPTSGLVH